MKRILNSGVGLGRGFFHFLYSFGDIPVTRLKYLPNSDWSAKPISSLIWLTLIAVERNNALLSVMT